MAKKSKLQVWAEYGAVRLILGILAVCPRPAALWLSKKLLLLAFASLKGLQRTGMRNLEIAFPEKPESERRAILRGSFESLGRVLGEMSQFRKYSPADIEKLIEFDIDPKLYEEYHRAKTEGRGAIITTGHMGNWELFVFAYAALYEPISYLARPLDNPLIEDLTASLRMRFGNRPINKTNAVMVASKLLREGAVLGILADVNAHPKEGVFVPFFGVPACTSSGAALLAMRTGSMIVPMCAVWDQEAGKYKALHGPAIYPPGTGDRERDITETTAAYTAEFEKFVRAYPDQWLWIHKRWKTRPRGEADLYRK